MCFPNCWRCSLMTAVSCWPCHRVDARRSICLRDHLLDPASEAVLLAVGIAVLLAENVGRTASAHASSSGSAMIGYLWIGLGGALGSMGRAWLAITVARITGPQFPWGTILINIIGSFVIGFFGTLTTKRQPLCRAGRCPRLRHGRHLRRVHHLLVIQSANAGTRARRPRGAGSWQYRALGRALPLAVAAGHYGAAAIHRQ